MEKDGEANIPSAPELKPGTSQLVREHMAATAVSAPDPLEEPDEPAVAEAAAPEATPVASAPELVSVERPHTAMEIQDEAEDADKQFDPGRGDYVDQLNDTTPPPLPPKRPVDWPQTEPASKKKHGGLIISIVIILLLAGGAYYWFAVRKTATTPAKTKTTTSQTTKTPAATTSDKIATTHYDSSNFALGLDYPSDWKVNDTATLLSVVSPQLSLTTSAGKQVQGYIYATIQPKQTTLPDFSKGSATAALESQKITYKTPTQNQRAQTYLTFASFATTASNGWDAIYITGDNGYTVGQDVPMSDVIQTDPLVTVRFLNCKDQTCSGTTTPYSLEASQWKFTTISAPVLSLLESLSFD